MKSRQLLHRSDLLLRSLCIFLLAALFFSFMGLTEANAQSYHAEDINKLRDFLSQVSYESSKLNIEQLWTGGVIPSDWKTGSDYTWVSDISGIEWEEVSGEEYIKEIRWVNKKLAGDLDLSDLPHFTFLNCGANYLTSLNCDNCPNLFAITCQNSPNLTTVSSVGSCVYNLHLQYCSNLKILKADGHESLNWTEIVQYLPALEEFYCVGTDEHKIENLDISNRSNLKIVDCSKNNIEALDLSGLPNLEILNCSDNQIAELDISGLSNLTDLNCSKNRIKLDIIKDMLNDAPGGCTISATDQFDVLFEQREIIAYDELDLTSLSSSTSVDGDFFIEREDGEHIEIDENYTISDRKIIFHNPGWYTVTVHPGEMDSYGEIVCGVRVCVGVNIECLLYDVNFVTLPGKVFIYPVSEHSGHQVADTSELIQPATQKFFWEGEYWFYAIPDDPSYAPSYFNYSDKPSPVGWQDADIIDIQSMGLDHSGSVSLMIFLAKIDAITDQPGAGKITIDGTVVDNGDVAEPFKSVMARPVAYATVILYGKPRAKKDGKSILDSPYAGYSIIAQMQTDDDGYFTFGEVTDAYEYLLHVEMAGYTMATTLAINPDDGYTVYKVQCLADVSTLIITGEINKSGKISSAHMSEAIPLKIYPNPSNGRFVIEFDEQGIYQITVVSLTGSLMFKTQLTSQTSFIDMSPYPAGIYLINIVGDKKQSVIRIVKNE